MPTLSEQQAADVQVMLANVEAAHQETVKSRTALSALIAVGKATCTDIRQYNLTTKAVYAYQASVCGIIRAQGGDAPVIPPPTYVAYRGVPGDQAIDIDCASAQMRGVGLGATAPYAGTTFIDPAKVEWRQGATTADVALINQVVAAGRAAVAAGGGQLGAAPAIAIVTLVIWGLVVTVAGYFLLKIAEALTDVPQKRETTRQIAIQAAEHRRSLEQRAACYADCTRRGRDPIDCAKACDRLVPGFKPTLPVSGLGIVGTVAGVAALGLAIYASWRFVAGGGLDRRGGGSSRGARRALPSGRDEIIDAEYTERAA